jgi:hypothetical protein
MLRPRAVTGTWHFAYGPETGVTDGPLDMHVTRKGLYRAVREAVGVLFFLFSSLALDSSK